MVHVVDAHPLTRQLGYFQNQEPGASRQPPLKRLSRSRPYQRGSTRSTQGAPALIRVTRPALQAPWESKLTPRHSVEARTGQAKSSCSGYTRGGSLQRPAQPCFASSRPSFLGVKFAARDAAESQEQLCELQQQQQQEEQQGQGQQGQQQEQGGQQQQQQQQVLVCTNKACRKSGSLQVVEYFKCLAPPHVEVVTTGCLGKCGNGPNVVILPGELQLSHCSTAAHIARLLEKQCSGADAETNLKAFHLQSRASEAFVKGHFSAAEALFSEALALGAVGGIPNILCSRAACRTAQGDVRGALEDLDEADRIKPGWSTTMIRRGQALEAAGEAEQALQVYARAADVDRDFRRSKLYLRKRKELQAAASA